MNTLQIIFGFIKKYLKSLIGALILAITLPIVLGQLRKLWVGPDSYIIYVVSDFPQKRTTSHEIFDGFKNTIENKQLEINGKKIEIVDKNDKGDPDRAKEISVELAKDNKTLMVVGHFYSTQTKAALPAYLEQDPPIPVIMTTETNPELIPSKFADSYCPILLLSPNDDDQAQTAAEFAIFKDEASVFWVIEDVSNRVYSSYLSIKFIEHLQEKKGKKVVLYSNNRSIPSALTLQTLGINCVFFAGEWSNALILIRQVKAIFPDKTLMIILSDGSVNDQLIKHGQEDVEGVYLTFPMNAEKYLDYGYCLYGKDAAIIISDVIQSANKSFTEKMKEKNKPVYFLKNLLNIHRVTDARWVINSIMQDYARDKKEFKGDLEDEPFFFDAKGAKGFISKPGTTEKVKFHVWQIQRDNKDSLKFVEIPLKKL
ncbi:MAG: ABC transporter substrate-binding protein [Candidatus Hodarchaeota archaeon]